MPKGQRNLIYPYERLGEDIELSLTNVLIDGTSPAHDPVVAQFRTANLSAVAETRWRRFEIDIGASMPVDAIETLQREGREPAAILIIECPLTNLRQTLQLVSSGAGTWIGTLALEHAQLSGQVLLRAVLAARTDGQWRREIGNSQIWTLHVDPPAIPIIDGSLPVQWLDFKEANQIPDGARKEPFFVDLSETPTIFLNSGFDGLTGLLSDDDNRPVGELALRDAEFRRIGTAAWLVMFDVASAAIVVEEGSEPTYPPAAWQETVLRVLLPRMFDESESETLLRVVSARQGDQAREVQQQAAAAVARVLDANGARLGRHIRDLAGDTA